MVRTFHTFDVIIIGGGTAGLSALKEVTRHTDNVLLIHDGPWGTTCARTGCMPSKALVHAAQLYHERTKMREAGIHGSEQLKPDIPKILDRVRERRGEFVMGVTEGMKQYEHSIIKGKAHFESPTKIRAGSKLFHAKSTIIATGSTPMIPRALEGVKSRIMTTDTLFEQKDLPSRIGVIGLGPMGLEMSQALARLGITVTAVHKDALVGGVNDPEISQEILSVLKQDMQVWMETEATAKMDGDEVVLSSPKGEARVDALLVTAGRKPNIQALGLKRLGISMNDDDIPYFNPYTMKIPDFPLFIAGDATDERAILHEATDEGKRAGFHAATDEVDINHRRVPLSIIFTHPNIAVIGESAHAMRYNGIVIGEASFEHQGRAIIDQENRGKIRLFAHKETGVLRGCEMMAPEGEHLAHLLALAMQQQMTAADVLKMPFYHPTLEEGLRTALRDVYRQVSTNGHGNGQGKSGNRNGLTYPDKLPVSDWFEELAPRQ